jgi:hypothetical protein
MKWKLFEKKQKLIRMSCHDLIAFISANLNIFYEMSKLLFENSIP